MKTATRTRSVGTKVTEEEYLQVEASAFGQGISISEWCRSALQQKARGTRSTEAEETLLAEVLALRMILVNLLFTVARGERMTADDMQAIIDRADSAKARRAADRLACSNREDVNEVQ